MLDPPSVAVDVPFTIKDVAAGDADLPIQAYLRVPNGSAREGGWPVLLFICGLDATAPTIRRGRRNMSTAASPR